MNVFIHVSLHPLSTILLYQFKVCHNFVAGHFITFDINSPIGKTNRFTFTTGKPFVLLKAVAAIIILKAISALGVHAFSKRFVFFRSVVVH